MDTAQIKSERVRTGLLKMEKDVLVDWIMGVMAEIHELQRRIYALECANDDAELLRIEPMGQA